MPSADDNDNNHDRAPRSSLDPFITFRRFADEQIKSLLGLVGDISDDIAQNARSQRRQIEQSMQERQRSAQDHADDGDGDGDDEIPLERLIRELEKETERTWKGWEKRLMEAMRGVERVGTNMDDDRLRRHEDKHDDGSETDHWEHTKHINPNGSTVHILRWPKPSSSPPPNSDPLPSITAALAAQTTPFATPPFFHASPYSPLHLERALPSFPWRDAFEDLLQAEQGQPLEEHGVLDARRRESMGEWLMGMAKRTGYPGLVRWRGGMREVVEDGPGFWERRWADAEHEAQEADERDREQEDDEEEDLQDAETDENDPLTEQALYSQHFGIPSSTSATPTPTGPTVAQSHILSTLTTTERTILPDGTVTTKVVLKKRFADGKEESSETLSTVLPSREDSHKSNSVEMDSNKTERGGDEKKGSGGWFWSS